MMKFLPDHFRPGFGRIDPVMSVCDTPIREDIARKIVKHHNRVQQALIDLVDDNIKWHNHVQRAATNSADIDSEPDIDGLTDFPDGLSEARCTEIYDISRGKE